jgi:hypothetical protein
VGIEEIRVVVREDVTPKRLDEVGEASQVIGRSWGI